ncbi:hypothetical protein [Methanobacterium sp. ACI-7]|uniref:hypothetical protein n=1 Tax=unclassified Methanobacterium TaxID=2627676 RepID=UPI0039C2FF36
MGSFEALGNYKKIIKISNIINKLNEDLKTQIKPQKLFNKNRQKRIQLVVVQC